MSTDHCSTTTDLVEACLVRHEGYPDVRGTCESSMRNLLLVLVHGKSISRDIYTKMLGQILSARTLVQHIQSRAYVIHHIFDFTICVGVVADCSRPLYLEK